MINKVVVLAVVTVVGLVVVVVGEQIAKYYRCDGSYTNQQRDEVSVMKSERSIGKHEMIVSVDERLERGGQLMTTTLSGGADH